MFGSVMRATDDAKAVPCRRAGQKEKVRRVLVRVGIVLRASAMHHADNL